ncbi:protein kinase domain-containing protein [Bacillus sp. AK128]
MNIQDIIKNYKLFIDTSTWMTPHANEFLENKLTSILLASSKQVILPQRIVQEVNKMMKNEDREKRHKAKAAANLLRIYLNQGVAAVFGDPSDPFADQTFLYVFQQFRVKYNLALITQDRGLAHDILNLNNQHAVQGKRIYAFRINESGNIEEWNLDRISSRSQQPSAPSRPTKTKEHRSDPPPKPHEKFILGTKVITQKETPMSVSKVPEKNETVYSKLYGSLRLKEEIGSGGEGKIFLASNGMVCKVYKEDRITHERYYKLKRMLEVPINKKGICWPKDILTNSSNEFVGYIMETAEGKPMQTSIFLRPVLNKNFPTWTRKDLVQLAITIINKIIYLHERNIVIGDINPMNILIKNEKEVYFVDTDSYQIENYPCPVGTINFTAPELQGKNFSTFLRSFTHEYFAVNTLMFMIMLPGQPPYSHQGGGTPGENIKQMGFPYPLGEEGKGTVPDGSWKYIWSHLLYDLKDALYKTFTGKNRATPEELRDLLVKYRQTISKGYLSDELFPDSMKIPQGEEAVLTCNDSMCKNPQVRVHTKYKNKIESRGSRYICDKCRFRRKIWRTWEQTRSGQVGEVSSSSSVSEVRTRTTPSRTPNVPPNRSHTTQTRTIPKKNPTSKPKPNQQVPRNNPVPKKPVSLNQNTKKPNQQQPQNVLDKIIKALKFLNK